LRAEQIMTRVLYYRLDSRVARLHDMHHGGWTMEPPTSSVDSC
jgi:hypothetical protein